MRLLISTIIFIFIIIFNTSHADDNTEKEITLFVSQMVNILNSTNISTVDKFFKYYSDPEVNFIKKVVTIYQDKDDFGVIELNMSLRDYLIYLDKLYKMSSRYWCTYKILSIDADGVNKTAYVQVSFEELVVYRDGVKDRFAYIDPNIIKSLAVSNCNLSFNTADSIKLLASNCIEKIVSQ